MLELGCLLPHPPIAVPEIGKAEVNKIADTLKAFRDAARVIVESKPEAIAIVTPHGQVYRDAFGVYQRETFEGSFAPFGQPKLKFEVAGHPKLAEAILSACQEAELPCVAPDQESGIPLDHGILVPLYFLREAGYEGAILPLTYSLLDAEAHHRFGAIVAEQFERLNVRGVLVASGDLSHRLTPDAPAGYSKRGAEFDQKIIEGIRGDRRNDILDLDEKLIREAGECGYNSLLVLFGAIPSLNIETKVLSYEGPFGVGYAVALWQPRQTPMDPAGFARKVLNHHFQGHSLDASGLPERSFGCFVCLKQNGQLRGCIGTILPTRDTLEDELHHNAIAAATQDPRFLPVTAEELSRLSITVDILGALEPVGSLAELDPKRFGVIVSHGRKQGVLLPNLEGVDTVEQQLGIAMQKAGIPLDQQIAVQRFRINRFEEI